MKPTKRKAFNFLRSYFDVFNELKDDKDKLDFLTSIINKQFLNEDPKDLSFIVKLCYESQRHSIESSVKGWLRVNNTDILGDPMTNPPTNPSTNHTTNPKEEEVKEKVKEKVKDIPAFNDFLEYAKTKKKNVCEVALKLKYDSWIENDWKDGNDKKITNWKTKILNTLQYIQEKKSTNNGMVY